MKKKKYKSRNVKKIKCDDVKKNKLLKLNKFLIAVLIFIQPIVDIIKTNIVNDIQVLGFSLFEFINIFLIFLCGLIIFYCSKDKKKFLKYSIFVILFVIYFVLHCYNISQFDNSVYEGQNVNYLVEFYYIYRTFVNALILVVVFNDNNCDKKYYIRVLEVFSLITSLVIIMSNIFKFGYQTYGDAICKYSIFDWFTFHSATSNSFQVLTCKGLFSSGNQLSSILFMILPIILYAAYKYKNKCDYFALVCQIIAMYMLGTKVSTLGAIAVLVAFFGMYIFFLILNKVKFVSLKVNNILVIFVIFIFAIVLFFFSPRIHNISFSSGNSSIENIESSESLVDEEKNLFTEEWQEIKNINCNKMNEEECNRFLEFFNKYRDYMGISEYIIKAYEVDKHPEFWCNYLQKSTTNDYRILKTNIINNIYEENNNKFDKYVGMGYTLNFIYTESDYSYQFYSYGIFGMILLIGPYFFTIFYVLFKILRDYKKKFNFENLLLLMGPVLALCVAYYSGHVFERTLPLLMIAFTCGINLINLKEK